MASSAGVPLASSPTMPLAISPQPPAQEVDIALLFDASPAPMQWYNHVHIYISRIVSQIHSLNPQSRIRLALITYSRAGSSSAVVRKSPILAQLPFSQPDVILNELKDHATELGLGRATSAGGMAVLEALIAAVEMFDNVLFVRPQPKRLASRTNILGAISDPAPRPIFHIIMFSHSQPNVNARAEWNQSQSLDGTTWERLPDELRKRKAHLNIVLMTPSTPLTQLHTKTEDHPQKSWFSIPPHHSLLLSTVMIHPSNENAAATTKRPHSAISEPIKAGNDTGTVSAVGNLENSPNKRSKQEATRSLREAPGTLNIPAPNFDIKQAQSSAQGPYTNPVVPPTQQPLTQNSTRTTQEEYRAAIQRHHQQHGTTTASNKGAAETLTSNLSSAPPQPKTPNPAVNANNPTMTPTTMSQASSNAAGVIHQWNGQPSRNLTPGNPSPAQILIANTQLQKSHAQQQLLLRQAAQAQAQAQQAQAQTTNPSPRTPAMQNAVAPRTQPSPLQTHVSPSNANTTATRVNPTQPQQSPNAQHQSPQPPPSTGSVASNAAQIHQLQLLAQQQRAAIPANLSPEQRKLFEQRANAAVARQQLLQQQQRAVQMQHQQQQPQQRAQQGLAPAPPNNVLDRTQPSPSPRKQQKRWTGTITWSAQDMSTRQTKELSANVIARPVQGSEESSKPELWPSKLLLSVASLSPLNLPELQAILKARNIPVCGFYPASQDGPSANNEKVYMALFTMLQQRNAVASVPCQFPGQPAGRGILLFPTPNDQAAKLFGAIFMNEDLPRLSQGGVGGVMGNIPTSAQFQAQQAQQTQQAALQSAQVAGVNILGSQGPRMPQQAQQLQQLFLAQQARARQHTAAQSQQNMAGGTGMGMSLPPNTPSAINALGFNPGTTMFNMANNAGGVANGASDMLHTQLRQQQQQAYAARPSFVQQPGGARQAPGPGQPGVGGVTGYPGMTMEMLQAFLAQQPKAPGASR